MSEYKFRAWDINPIYDISEDGKVYSNDYQKRGYRKELKQRTDKDGYKFVVLFHNTKRYKRMVHRLVAMSFLEEDVERTQVNHKNGNREDNRIINLEWVTHRENVIHGWQVNGRNVTEASRKKLSLLNSGENNKNSKLTADKITEMRKLRSEGMMLKELSEIFNISVSHAGAITSGRCWSNT